MTGETPLTDADTDSQLRNTLMLSHWLPRAQLCCRVGGCKLLVDMSATTTVALPTKREHAACLARVPIGRFVRLQTVQHTFRTLCMNLPAFGGAAGVSRCTPSVTGTA
jgi:hypothetical protein